MRQVLRSRRQQYRTWALLGIAAILAYTAWADEHEAGDPGPQGEQEACHSLSDQAIRISGGSFRMGQTDYYREEGPVRITQIDAFWIDSHEVTNRQFADFVSATEYTTQAEKPPSPTLFHEPLSSIPAHMLKAGSAVFISPEFNPNHFSDWWEYVPGASWRTPHGPDGPDAVPNEPVVHLTWADMNAYAEWRGGRLPTEAEWEFAARQAGASYTQQPSASEANSWQGIFPIADEGIDGFKGIAPVGCFQPNHNGLYDMVGNVWEVTADYYRPGHDLTDTDNPRGPTANNAVDPMNPGFTSRVIKGGSFLCAPNFCRRYRPAARQAWDPNMGTSHVGFRLAYDHAPQ